MRYRITDLLLITATLAVALGWRSFFLQDLTFKWHERHPVMPVIKIVDGQEVTSQERVLMYETHDQFFWPKDFDSVYAKFYVPRLLQLISLTIGTLVITAIAFRRWPNQMWQILLYILIPLSIIIFLLLPGILATRD